MNRMMVSILIPVKGDNRNLRECVEACLRLDYPDFEVMILPDEMIDLPYSDRVRIIPTGPLGPAKKRDMALDRAKGEILAFLDDDAFPRPDWLKNAVKNFGDEDVAAVGGPAVTPDNDTWRQKASGQVYASFLVSGPHNRRYIPKQRCETDDYPSCNFLVRKDAFERIGGFNTKFWPGEDTVFCLKLTKELKKKIIYDPDTIVYHHRRPLFRQHLMQIKSYALHRGYFVKHFPATSFKISYFIPSIFVLGLVAGAILSFFNPILGILYTEAVLLYLFLGMAYSFKRNESVQLQQSVFMGIILTHLTYGVYFIKGLLLKRLSEE